ncbi:MAG: hypothetical protein EOO15_13660 [Chitinophagaceae bacterium]|nr:MAG: hypothetical protein EOO15_13660 [Chitinophagaceae bacterium]
MKLLLLALLLPLLAPQQESIEDLLDRKWYRSYRIEAGQIVDQHDGPVYGLPWIYFGTSGLFEDFAGPKKNKSGKWKLQEGAVLRITFTDKKTTQYIIRKLTAEILELETSSGTIIGFRSGRSSRGDKKKQS